jgi:hypothetical protein
MRCDTIRWGQDADGLRATFHLVVSMTARIQSVKSTKRASAAGRVVRVYTSSGV